MGEDIFPAHIRNAEDGSTVVQTVSEHCHHTSVYAQSVLAPIGFGESAFLAGILHDMGKYTDAFRTYIEKANRGEKVVRGSVNHTFAAVHYILDYFEGDDAVSILTKDILAYAAGAHHGQFDCMDENGVNGFEYRRLKNDIHFEEARKNYIDFCESEASLKKAYARAVSEMAVQTRKLKRVANLFYQNAKVAVFHFCTGLTARMLQSSVIEGDRRDTAEFMRGEHFPDRNTPEMMSELWRRELHFAEGRIGQFDTSSTVNQARRKISDLCRSQADEPCGLYQLNVPTGSGKTLSALRFALAHAQKWKKQRIIFTSPLLSILEQNATVIRDFLDDPSIILEHHSNVVQPKDDQEELDMNELRIASWNAPVIITTLVQFLNTLFSGETSCIRRFHALCDAVIVIDEVQSIPTNLLTMFNLAISFLTMICGTTVLLCSATQPNWNKADYPLPIKPKELITYDPVLWKPFERVQIHDGGKCRLETLAEHIVQLSNGEENVLIICNKKSESEMLYQELSKLYPGTCYHLSASMCVQHRRKTLEQIRDALSHPERGKTVCVSTQVIEAGVDISFACVIRLLAGLDSVAQAAGRCNRNGERRKPGQVYTLNCTDEDLTHLAEIHLDKKASEQTLEEYHLDPGKFRNDLSSDRTIQTYFAELYGKMQAGWQNDPVPDKHYSVFELLSDNRGMRAVGEKQQAHLYLMHQAFRTAGRYFHVFNNSTIDVVVPYEDGRNLIADLGSERAQYDYNYSTELLHRARNYTVTLYPYQKQQLEKAGALIPIPELDVWYLADGYYDDHTGVSLEKHEMDFMSC